MKQLQDRVAIVTGASSGIGKAIAEIRDKGGAAEAAAADVTKEADVDALFAKVVKAHGRVDIVVNNAGVAAGKPIDEMSLDYWIDVVNANMTSVFLMGRAAVKQMKAQTPAGRPDHQHGKRVGEAAAAEFHRLHRDQVRGAGHDPPAHH